ncbi:MAG TPA: hypothetical protein VN739_03550 [Nitrososphaerales archaeon]|nr:hypothetical protein [Nitrososphaerales archaeon]
MSFEVALLLSIALIATVIAAMFSRSTSLSLIMLFYSSLILGIIFATYGGILPGLVHIITFAGAVSVMLLTVTLMTGESKLMIGSFRLALLLSIVSVPVVGAATYQLLQGVSTSSTQPSIPGVTSLFQFIWEFRSWDLLILIMVFAASMTVIVNLFSRKS